MKLQKRLAAFMAGTMLASAMPVWATDYANHWAKDAIEKWSANGVVKGYEDGTFKPNQQVTRAELASFVVRVFGLSEVGQAKTYTDVVQGKWYCDAIAAISSAGIMKDDGDLFRPDDFATREETAYVLANAYELTGGTLANFNDSMTVSDWAKDQFSALVGSGVINGKTNATGNLLAPKDAVTRAEVVLMLDRLTAAFYATPGTYSEDVVGNVVINTKDVILKDARIEGNLYIAEGVGDGDVTLDDTVVTGKVIIEGGGENSVKFTNGSKADYIKVEKADGKVRVVIDELSTVGDMVVESGVKIDGNVQSVEAKTTEPIQVLSGTIEKLVVSQEVKEAVITLDKGVEVKEVNAEAKVEISGEGKIETAIIQADGVELKVEVAQVSIPENVVEKIEVAVNGTVYDKEMLGGNTSGTTTGGSGGGGGFSSSSSSGSNGSVNDTINGDTNTGDNIEDEDEVVVPYASISLNKILASDVAKTGVVEAIVTLHNASFIKEKGFGTTSGVNGEIYLEQIDENTLNIRISGVNPMLLSDAWKITIPARNNTFGKDFVLTVPVEKDTFILTTPSKILKSEATKGKLSTSLKLVNTRLTVPVNELMDNVSLNLSGVYSIGIEDITESINGKKVSYQQLDITWENNKNIELEDLPDEWKIIFPKEILTTDKDLEVVISLLEENSENIVNAVAAKIPDYFTMYSQYHGDNLYVYLNNLLNIEQYEGVDYRVDVLAFNEPSSNPWTENGKFIEEDGTINYLDGDRFSSIPLNITVTCGEASTVVNTGLIIDSLFGKDVTEDINGFKRINLVKGEVITSGGAFVTLNGEYVDINEKPIISAFEGDKVTFSLVSDEPIFKNSTEDEENRGYIKYGPLQVVETKNNNEYSVSEDGKILTFELTFSKVEAGGKIDFEIPTDWLIDSSKVRYTQYLTIKKADGPAQPDEGGGSGNEGGDSGNEGGDSGNEGGDSGNEGGDSGNEGGDSGNEGGDSGNEGGGSGNEGGGSGNEGGDSDNEGGDSDNEGGDSDNEEGDSDNEGGDSDNEGGGSGNEEGGSGNEEGGSGNEGGGSGKPDTILTATPLIENIVASQIADIGAVEVEIQFSDATFKLNENYTKDSIIQNINGVRNISQQGDILKIRIEGVHPISLPDEWEITILAEKSDLTEDICIMIPIEKDTFILATPSQILTSIAKNENKLSTVLQIVNSEENEEIVFQDIKSNITGTFDKIDDYLVEESLNGQKVKYTQVEIIFTPDNLDNLGDLWKIVIPYGDLSTGEAFVIDIPLVDDNDPQNIVDTVISNLPANFTMNATEDGGNLFRHLSKLLGIDKFGDDLKDLTFSTELLNYKSAVDSDGNFINYGAPGNVSSIPLKVTVKYTGAESKVAYTRVNFVNDYTPEDIVNEVISSLPEKNEFYFNRDGDNLFRYLTQLMDMSKFDSNLAFYSSIDEENSKYVDGEGYLTYPEIGQTYTISLKAILKYGDAEADKQITVVVNNEEEDRGTRLAIVQGAAVTSGDSFFVEGEVVDVNANLELKPTIWETLTLSVIAEEGTFKPSEQNFPIEVIGPSQVFVIGTDDTTYKVSDDGSIFTFDMAFMRLNTGGKAEFKIPGDWFEDGEPRYTKYITVRKN